MNFFKKIIRNFSSNLNNEPAPDNSEPVQAEQIKKTEQTDHTAKATYDNPDYSAYIYIRPEADIYVISISNAMHKKVPQIVSEYEKARKSYASIHQNGHSTSNYRSTFNYLNKVFESMVDWFCCHASIPTEGKNLKQRALELPKAGFTDDQMNVVHGVLHAMDKFNDNSLIVSELVIKMHFVSLGCLLKVLKAACNNKKTENVYCSFYEKSLHKDDEQSNCGSVNENNIAPPADSIQRDLKKAFNHAKKLYRDNEYNLVINSLCDMLSLVCKKIYRRKHIPNMPKQLSEQINLLMEKHILTKGFQNCAKSILSAAKECADGKNIKAKDAKRLIQNAGSVMFDIRKCITQTPAALPSFKKMEQLSEPKEINLQIEYPDLFEYTEKAKKNISIGEYKDSLALCRNALELMVNALCDKNNIPYDVQTDLRTKIDLLHSDFVISKSQKDIMQQSRKLGNDGAHYNKTVTENDAVRCIDLIDKTKSIFTDIINPKNTKKNTPMFDPDYYSNSRKYYGRWTYITTEEQLLLDLSYVQLARQANNGDIEAMLDMATGFLLQTNKIKWTDNHLIVSPNFEKNGYKTWPDPLDTRYYFWIINACKKAYSDWINGKVIPLKYIATALAEGILYILSYTSYKIYNLNEDVNKPNYLTQHDLSVRLFGKDVSFTRETMHDIALMLITMLDEYDCDTNEKAGIIAPIHKRNINAMSVKRYLYTYNFYIRPNCRIDFEPQLLLDPHDTAKTFTDVINEREIFANVLRPNTKIVTL